MPDPASAALREIATPALVISREALDRNIEHMANLAAAAGVALRPHAKTHKSADIAKRQVLAGAVGIACATVGEVEHLAGQGLDRLLLTGPIAERGKAARLARLNRQCDLESVVDHIDQAKMLSAANSSSDRPLRLLVDTDVGQARTGIVEVAAGVHLAQAIARTPGVEFAGIQGFAGQAQHILDEAGRRSEAAAAANTLKELAAALAAAGLPPGCISGSGTGTSSFDFVGPYTELQVGSYVFMDADYARLEHDGGELPFAHSLFVLSTVVSTNRRGQATVDAGTKALAVNGPAPTRFAGVPAGTSYRFAGDEHGILDLPPGGEAPAIGSRVLIEASHCDPTVNLFSRYHALDGDGGVSVWPIGARHL